MRLTLALFESYRDKLVNGVDRGRSLMGGKDRARRAQARSEDS
jgi:hypothetical protein